MLNESYVPDALTSTEADVLRAIDELEHLVWRAHRSTTRSHRLARRARVHAGRFADRISEIRRQIELVGDLALTRRTAEALAELNRLLDRTTRRQSGGIVRVSHGEVVNLCHSLRCALDEPTAPSGAAAPTGTGLRLVADEHGFGLAQARAPAAPPGRARLRYVGLVLMVSHRPASPSTTTPGSPGAEA